MPENMKVGLVLSGGGAKGAYQVGVLRALLELGTRIDVVAGASIGALNAAILASAPSLETGVERLEEVWQTLAESSPIALKLPDYLVLLAAAGLPVRGYGYYEKLVAFIQEKKQGFTKKDINEFNEQFSLLAESSTNESEGVLCDKPLKKLMTEYIDLSELNQGLPLYISVYKSHGGFFDILGWLLSSFSDTAESEFLHIQSLPKTEQKEALLASAALPCLYATRQVNNSRYADGGLGGAQKMQGNTPITPLLQAGCTMVIVTHLSDGSLWSRQDFPEATILEIRPQSAITRDPSLFDYKDLLGFDPHKIPSWIEQGYKDTLHCVGRVMKAGVARNELRRSEKVLEDSEKRNELSDNTLADAMSRLI